MYKLALVTVALALFGLNRAGAQPKNDFTVDDVVRRIAPAKQDGQPIAKDDRVLAGIVAAVGFGVVVVVTRVAIRFLATIFICVIFGAGAIFLWSLVEDGRLNTWPALALAAVIVGVVAGCYIAVVGLFALEPGPSSAAHGALAAAQQADESEIKRLTAELEALKKKIEGKGAST